MARRPLPIQVILFLVLLLASGRGVFSTAAYPPYGPYPPTVITVHLTNVTYTGPPSTSFNFNVSTQDSLSPITKLAFNTTSPQSSFTISIYQLNAIPPTIAGPVGRTLLVFEFSLDPVLKSNITSAVLFVRVPRVELQEFGVRPDTLQIQRLIFPMSVAAWTPLPTIYSNTANAQNVYIGASSPDLSTFAVTGLQSNELSAPVSAAILFTIVASSVYLLARRRRQLSSQNAVDSKALREP